MKLVSNAQCLEGPFGVNFRPSQPCPECLLLGVKRTSISGDWMSACSQTRTLRRQWRELSTVSGPDQWMLRSAVLSILLCAKLLGRPLDRDPFLR